MNGKSIKDVSMEGIMEVIMVAKKCPRQVSSPRQQPCYRPPNHEVQRNFSIVYNSTTNTVKAKYL